MVCPNCGSNNVSVQVVQNAQLVNKHHSVLWWCFIGWWWVPCKWLFLTIPALILKIFVPKRQKLVLTEKTVCVCQNCGYHWNIP